MRLLSITVIIMAFFTTSCASYFLKKRCEKTNWYQLGYDSAMKGERAASNPFVGECERAEGVVRHDDLSRGFKAGMGNYCTLKTAFSKGREGEKFNLEFCDSGKLRKLKSQFKSGVIALCTKDGYKFGASGKVYSNQCEKKLERKFLVKYKKGRKKYLKGEIRRKRDAINSIETEVYELERDRSAIQSQLTLLPTGKVMKKERTYDPVTRTYREEVRMTEDEETKRKKEMLQGKVAGKNREITKSRDRRKALQNEIRTLQRAYDAVDEIGEES